MPTDLYTLLRRDHEDLQHDLTQLLEPEVTTAQLRSSLDAVRLGLIAHAEAEEIVLGRFAAIPALESVISDAHRAHVAQEAALSKLVSSRPRTAAWRQSARELRALLRDHAVHEERELVPALRMHAPSSSFGALAGAFATERLRQLAMLQPSAPMFMPDAADVG